MKSEIQNAQIHADGNRKFIFSVCCGHTGVTVWKNSKHLFEMNRMEMPFVKLKEKI